MQSLSSERLPKPKSKSLSFAFHRSASPRPRRLCFASRLCNCKFSAIEWKVQALFPFAKAQFNLSGGQCSYVKLRVFDANSIRRSKYQESNIDNERKTTTP